MFATARAMMSDWLTTLTSLSCLSTTATRCNLWYLDGSLKISMSSAKLASSETSTVVSTFEKSGAVVSEVARGVKEGNNTTQFGDFSLKEFIRYEMGVIKLVRCLAICSEYVAF